MFRTKRIQMNTHVFPRLKNKFEPIPLEEQNPVEDRHDKGVGDNGGIVEAVQRAQRPGPLVKQNRPPSPGV